MQYKAIIPKKLVTCSITEDISIFNHSHKRQMNQIFTDVLFASSSKEGNAIWMLKMHVRAETTLKFHVNCYQITTKQEEEFP